MKVVAGVLTWQQYQLNRHDLFVETVRSLSGVDALFLVDNGSTDGTAEYVRGLGGYVNTTGPTSCGYGMNLVAAICARAAADIVIFSNDDIVWAPGAVEQLRDIWAVMPPDVKIVSGLLQPTYFWNRPVSKEGPVLIRETVSGGAWTYRAGDYPLIFPVPIQPGGDDVPTCRRLNSLGYRVGAVDLASHVGEERSSWGNVSYRWEEQSAEQVKTVWAL